METFLRWGKGALIILAAPFVGCMIIFFGILVVAAGIIVATILTLVYAVLIFWVILEYGYHVAGGID